MNVRDVCNVIEQLAPPGLAYPWDNAGLNIGAYHTDVQGVLIALTVTRDVLNAAVEAKANLIVSHHPVLWEPLTALRTDDPTTRLYLDIAQAGIAAYSAHTNLDVTPGGVNDVLAKKLGLKDVKPLLPLPHAGQVKLVTFVPDEALTAVRAAVCEAGAGHIGEYSYCSFSAKGTGSFVPSAQANPAAGKRLMLNEEAELRFEVLVPKARLAGAITALKKAHPYEEIAYDVIPLDNEDPTVGMGVRGKLPQTLSREELAHEVCKVLELKHVRTAGTGDSIESLAIVGGSGADKVEELPADVDAFITGDVGYHHALTANVRGIVLIDAGHAGLEKWIVPALASLLTERLSDLPITTYSEPETFEVVTP